MCQENLEVEPGIRSFITLGIYDGQRLSGHCADRRQRTKFSAFRELASYWEERATNWTRKISRVPDRDVPYGKNIKTDKWKRRAANLVAVEGRSETR